MIRLWLRYYSKSATEAERRFLKIGDVRVPIRHAQRPELVPISKKNSITCNQTALSHLKWLLQKDVLNQDVFLLGVPGSIRSSIVLQYLNACNREYEYLAITRDTTEADIKQRREIKGGRAFYTDLCAVRAALNGRVLVIDGVEKAERNVLPILNNLLENREMQLDDGRFLMHHEKYDELSTKYSSEELKKMGLERVSPDFHVIALGLPVPRFTGHSLDPPLRSRFQCRHVLPLPFEDTVEICKVAGTSIKPNALNDVVAVSYALNSQEELKLPLVPIDNLEKVVNIWNSNPFLGAEDVLHNLYPMKSVLRETDMSVANEFLKKFGIKNDHETHYNISGVSVDGNDRKVSLSTSESNQECLIETSANGLPPITRSDNFIPTVEQEKFLADLVAAHAVGDFAVIGPKGSGKSKIINELGKRLGFTTETLVLYQDMNSRELIQRRRMLRDGDTVWEDSQLVTAAKEGHVCVLDGAERIHWSGLESLSFLIHHRSLDLPNGERLVGEAQFKAIREKTGFSKEEMEKRGIYCIPSSFRIALVGDSDTAENHWINDAVLSLVPFFNYKALSSYDQADVIQKLVSEANIASVKSMVNLVSELSSSHDGGLRGIATSLSFRKMIHIARRDALHSGELRSLLEKAALSRFLPSITKTAFDNLLNNLAISDVQEKVEAQTSLQEDLDKLRRSSHVNPGDEALVPNVIFYDNEQHVNIMRDMARDLQLGSHLLLIGNQGVGKNKITDRFLHLINRPRLYIQLHRDTTVESLTVQCSVEQGIVKYDDSALVKAARSGHILVVDEADKAPLHVIAILKSLLDTGTLVLGDGRRLQPADMPQSERTIPLHPEFRMIMLANRPGFPFLGNDLFGVLGDLFSVHTVDNPSRANEIVMLKKYGPNVPQSTLQNLVSAFSELRDLADDGSLQYPYSTRELVNIIKHTNEFPNDPITSVVKNVLDFDEYSPDAVKTIEEVFRKHGIPLGIDRPLDRILLSQRFEIPSFNAVTKWGTTDNVIPYEINATRSDLLPSSSVSLGGKMLVLGKENMRTEKFSEEVCSWQLPTLDVNICSDGIFINNNLIISTVNPCRLYIINDLENTSQVEEFDLADFFPRNRRAKYQPRIRLSSLPDGNQVLIHEEVSNRLLIFDLKTKIAQSIDFSEGILGKIENLLENDEQWRMVSGNTPIIYERGGRRVRALNEHVHKLEVDKELSSIMAVSPDRWLLKYEDNSLGILCLENDRWRIRQVDSDSAISQKLEALRTSENKVIFKADGFYALRSDGFPLLSSETIIDGSIRTPMTEVIDHRRPYYLSDEVTKKFLDPNRNMALLSDHIMVTAKANWETPKTALPPGVSSTWISGFLEVIDTKHGMVQYVPVSVPKYTTYHGSWLASLSKTSFTLIPWDNTKLITLDNSGGIRSYEISSSSLGRSLNAWRQMIGEQEGPLRMEFMKGMDDFDFSKLDEPKLGKFDPDNTPHVGGNQWMGGTGGYNTAGLGGVGGPFRLDAGHDVHQMPEFAKQQVPEHLLQKAREIAKAEYQKKLKEIKMSEYDDDAYNKLWERIDKQSIRLKGIIDQLEARKKERQWARHQTSGDFDDSKIIEGITGEKNIYRRRIEKLPEAGAPQQHPKRMKVVFDVSGSMYRFNGYDKRLQKSLEACLMVMTALEGKEQKIVYDIVGHSGETPCLNFVLNGNYPKNNKERLDILKQMLAHTQYCSSGDFTTEALDVAIKELGNETDCDEKIVILVSDANLERYGIRPKHITDIMSKSDDVNSFIIFIGSLGEQAEKLQRALPAGKAFVCKDTSELPQIMQNIFASTLI